MKEISGTNFGLVIAYLLPGFLSLWGLAPYSETIRTWLGSSSPTAPTVGGFLYVTLASLAAGMIVSVARWASIDTLHRITGLRHPQWDFRRLADKLPAFTALVELHYRYYQAYANSMLALALVYVLREADSDQLIVMTKSDAGYAGLLLLLFAGSRDTLRKYYTRMAQLLGIEKELPRRRRGGVRQLISARLRISTKDTL